MEEEPEILCVYGARFRCGERVADLMLETVEQLLDDLFLRGVVVVKIAGTDANIGGDG